MFDPRTSKNPRNYELTNGDELHEVAYKFYRYFSVGDRLLEEQQKDDSSGCYIQRDHFNAFIYENGYVQTHDEHGKAYPKSVLKKNLSYARSYIMKSVESGRCHHDYEGRVQFVFFHVNKGTKQRRKGYWVSKPQNVIDEMSSNSGRKIEVRKKSIADNFRKHAKQAMAEDPDNLELQMSCMITEAKLEMEENVSKALAGVVFDEKLKSLFQNPGNLIDLIKKENDDEG